MPLRMAEYALGVYRRFERFPRQIVLYVGEPVVRMQPSLTGAHFSFSYELRDLRDLDGDGLLGSDEIGDNIDHGRRCVGDLSVDTRDKMSAARRKGKWIGGHPVLGYDIDSNGGRIIVNPAEADQVRTLFGLYLTRGSTLPVLQETQRVKGVVDPVFVPRPSFM